MRGVLALLQTATNRYKQPRLMGTEEEKQKHSKRLHRDASAAEKQVRIAKSKGKETADHFLKISKHRFEKQHVMDCGRPRCGLCSNSRKLFGEKTIQERRFEQDVE